MRKWVIVFLGGVVLLLAAVYFFIPNIIKFKSNVAIKATRPGIHRMLLDKSNMAKWWPGKIINDSFYLNSFVYQINNSNITVMPIGINGKKSTIATSLYLIEIKKDSTLLEWVGAMVSSYNPIKRFKAYLKARKINNNMETLLQKMKTFYAIPENIYGFKIKEELVVDSILIQTSDRCKGYPNSQFIYNLISKLRNYAANYTANETGYPMLNVNATDSVTFNVKVALPIDKVLPTLGDVLQKRMLGRGNILVTEVKGGIDITNKAFIEIQKYAEDYQRSAPAIPFYSLITDRLKEPDTTKWVTKIYFPVM
jgi:hypothetical protein